MIDTTTLTEQVQRDQTRCRENGSRPTYNGLASLLCVSNRTVAIPVFNLMKQLYIPLRDELAKISPQAADALRDAVWHKDGKWHGVGLGGIPKDELIQYALDLEKMVIEGEEIPLCEYKL